MAKPVYIAGLGVVSAIGNNVRECLDSLTTDCAGIEQITFLDTVHKGEIPVAEVKLTNERLAELTRLPADMSRTGLLSCMAAKEALDSSEIKNIEGLRIGFVSANTVGGMDKTEQFYQEFYKDQESGNIEDVRHHGCGNITEIVADKLGITSYVTTISTACSSSANTIFLAARLIRNGVIDAAVAGGVDALTKFTLNGFNTLMILDRELCKPFDEDRHGLNLGEGAGYVVLVSEEVARKLSKAPYATLAGYANANDAFHQTATSPNGDGPYLAMKSALERAGLKPADIDYVNLHGTGTPNNDQSEGTAIERIFGNGVPPVSSTKAFTGHTLGASGGIEAVFSILALNKGLVFPNLRFAHQMNGLDFSPQRELMKDKPLKHVLSNSFGFGGNCTSLVFSKAS